MIIQKIFFLSLFISNLIQSDGTKPLAEQFKQAGYLEICDTNHGAATFDSMYQYFDEMIEFLQENPTWAQKLYTAKERFIRSKDKNYYSSNFFGFYDESLKEGRNQIAFYYSVHFHTFINKYYRECNKVPEIMRFLDTCCDIQKSYLQIFEQAAADLNLETIFSSDYGKPPILLKVVKYFPSYNPTKPHYDGTAFSLFLDSTDNQSLLISPYKSTYSVNDFSCAYRTFAREANTNSILLIPGSLLTACGIYPTPHIVIQSGKTRYATIAFAMRPHYVSEKNELSILPSFNY